MASHYCGMNAEGNARSRTADRFDIICSMFHLRIALLAPVAVAVLLAACGTATRGADQDATRLQVLEDQQEIARVLTNYGRYLDARDLRAYSELFAEEGEWVGGFGTAKGPEGIYQFMVDNLSNGGNPANTYHILSNFEIDVDGEEAEAWSRWAFITPDANGQPRIAQGGRYEDRLVRENGAWKFLRREAFLDIPASLSPAQVEELSK